MTNGRGHIRPLNSAGFLSGAVKIVLGVYIMEKNAVFTIGIVAYRNYRYVNEALNSVFMQNYQSIELIVSNDGSDDFDEAEVLKYISENKTDNIIRFRVNNNVSNLGTCKHLNKVKSMASGQYIMFMAADDALYDEDSVSKIVEAFQKNGAPLFVCGKCGMYDCDMDKRDLVVPIDSVRGKLINLSPEELYRDLSTDMFIPTAATTYNMKAFDILGDFDERVFLVEDWAFFLKAFRSGYKPYYLNELVSKHRDGGLAHGNASNVSQISQFFLSDEIIIMEIELLPYKSILGKGLFRRLEKRHEYLKTIYESKYSEVPFSKQIVRLLKKSPTLLPRAAVKGFNFVRYRFIFQMLEQRRLINAVLMMVIFALLTIFSENIPYCRYISGAALLSAVMYVANHLLGLVISFLGAILDTMYAAYAKIVKRQ